MARNKRGLNAPFLFCDWRKTNPLTIPNHGIGAPVTTVILFHESAHSFSVRSVVNFKEKNVIHFKKIGMRGTSNILIYITYKLILFCIVIVLLSSIAILAAFTSWNYLLLYVPLLLYYYATENREYGKKKHTDPRSKTNRW